MSKNEHFENAMRKVSENDFESAIELFGEALKQDSNKETIYYNRAVAYLNSEKIDLAIFDFNKLIDIDSNNAFYYSCRAFAKARTKDKKGALSDYEIAIKLDPNNPITYNNMGLVQEDIGYMKQAQKSFEQSDDLRKKEEAGKVLNLNSSELDKKEVNDRIDNAKKSQVIEPIEEKTKGQITKDIFTDKSTFKEFIAFIKNGFKLKR